MILPLALGALATENEAAWWRQIEPCWTGHPRSDGALTRDLALRFCLTEPC
jgi:hypothetical protein